MTSLIPRNSLRLAIVSLSIHTVVAADGLWTNADGGSWALETNWATGVVADGAGATADFSTLDLTANAAVTLDGDRTAGTLKFADTAASNDWTLATGVGGLLTLTGPSKPEIATAAGTTTVSAAIAGAQGFRKTGAGSLVLSGANTYTGTLLVSAGTLKAGNAASIGATGNGNETIVSSGATFDIAGQALTPTEIYRIAGTGVGGAGALVNTGGDQQNAINRVVLDGNASVGGTNRFDLRAGTGPTLDLAGYTLTKTGENQVSLVATTVTAGNIVVNSGVLGVESTTTADANGTVTLNSPGAIGLWANVAGSFNRPIVSNNGAIRNLGSDATLNSPVSLTTGTTLTVEGTATTYMAGAISGTGNLVKNGTGAFTFAGNTFTGKTTINGGYFGVTGEGGFGAAPAAFVADHITLANGATGGIGNVVNGYYYGPTFGPNRGITITADGGGFEAYGHEGGRSVVTVNGVISGPGTLYKTGGGALLVNAANTYEGGTSVANGPGIAENVGALRIGNYAGLGTGDVTFTNTASITGLQFPKTGTLTNNIVLSSAASTTRFYVDPGVTTTLSGEISGGIYSGGFLQTDGGTLILEGAKTYSSATVVNSGTLLVNGDIVDSSVLVKAGASFGGSGDVYVLTLEEGSRIIASPGLNSIYGVYADKTDKGVDVIVKDAPVTPGTHTVDVLGYGDDVDGGAPELGNFNTAAYRSGVLTNDTVNNRIKLSYASSNLTWAGASGTWDAGTSVSWVENNGKFYQGDAVTFNDPAAAATVTLVGAVAPAAIVVNNTNDYTITPDLTPETGKPGSIAGGSLTKGGTGMLVLPTANSFSGGTTINGGTISLSATTTTAGGSALALGSGTVAVNTGGTLKLWLGTGAYSLGNSLVFNGGTLLGEDGTNALSGLITLQAGGGTFSPKLAGKDLQVTNTIAGSGKLTIQYAAGGAAGATVALSGNNTYSGGTDIASGTVRIANYDSVFGTGGITFTGSAMIATNAGGGTRTLANGITLNSGAVATFDGGYFPVILNGAITGAGGLAQASSGIVALGGNNNYTGGTTLGGSGSLRLDSGTALGTTGGVTFSGGTLMYTAANTVDYSARFAVATNQAYRVNTNGQNVTWASPLTATAGFFKFGEGTLSLTGASTYTGGTNAQGGVIETALISDAGATPIGTFTSANGSYISFGGGTFRYTGAASVTTGRYMWNDQVSGTFEVTNAAATVAFTNTSGSLNRPFTKTGAGTLTLADGIDGANGSVTVAGGRLNLNGNNTYTGNTTVTAGTLSMATATLPNAGDVRLSAGTALNLGFTGTDDIDQLFIDGVEMAKGTWGSSTSAATYKSPLITGTGILNVLTGPTGGGSGGYDAWATANGLTAANNAKTADPDGDGMNNLGEFAFDGVALSGKSSGKVVSKVATIDGVNYLTLTVPVRVGAVFNEDMVSALIDGVVYRVQGTLNLSNFTLDVVEITGTDASALQGTLPILSSTDWIYRSFRSTQPLGSESKQFLRVLADEQ